MTPTFRSNSPIRAPGLRLIRHVSLLAGIPSSSFRRSKEVASIRDEAAKAACKPTGAATQRRLVRSGPGSQRIDPR